MPQTVSKNFALDERSALDLQAQRHEEGGHGVEICDREADVTRKARITRASSVLC